MTANCTACGRSLAEYGDGPCPANLGGAHSPPSAETSYLPWSVDGLGARVMAAVESVADNPTPARLVAAIMALLNEVGYDSYDREVAFRVAVAVYAGGGPEPAITYNDLYDAWMEAPAR